MQSNRNTTSFQIHKQTSLMNRTLNYNKYTVMGTNYLVSSYKYFLTTLQEK